MKKISGNLENILIALFVAFLLFGVTASGNLRVSERGVADQRKRECVRNMNTIRGAMELYQLENGTVTMLTLHDLMQRGYVKTELRCPPAVKNFLFFRKVEPVPYMYKLIIAGGAGNQVMFDVECPTHGKLSLNGGDKTAGL